MHTFINKRLKIIALLPLLFFIAAGCGFFGFGGSSAKGPFGVLKTTDGGATWRASNTIEAQKNASIANDTVSEMTFDPGSSSNIYLGTIEDGLLFSSNAAKTWKQLLSKVAVYDFWIDPKDSKTIYVSGAFAGHGRIIRTKDGGATWEEMYNEASDNNIVHTITANPNNDQEIYAGLDSGTLIKSVDGGVHWFVLNNLSDVPLRLRFNKLNNEFYVLLAAGGLQKSADLGNTWNSLVGPLTQQSNSSTAQISVKTPSIFQRVAIDEQTSGTIYLTSDAGLFKTTDDGKSWAYLNVPVKTSDLVPYAVASSKGGMVVYTSVQNTILKSLDGGQSWQTQELPTDGIVSRIIVDPNNPQTAYSGLLAQ